MMNLPNADHGRPTPPEPAAPAPGEPAPGEPAPGGRAGLGAAPLLPEQSLPEQSREDTDAGWGEYPERPDDRLYRDRPPHWDDF
jgi:hypothetical protein